MARNGRPLLLISIAALTACARQDDGPVRAFVIGGEPRIVDPGQRPLAPSDAVLIGAAAEGLVRLDAAGQIVPGLAERWNVSDDGLSYIFRIGDRRWPDGGRVTARFVVTQLRAATAPATRNPMGLVLTGIEEIVATTDEVLEIRLKAPRPNLLQHLARPELAIVREGAGAGPFRVEHDGDEHLHLTRTVPAGEEDREDVVLLAAARPALAVALFDDELADVVLGGTLDDYPLLKAADPPAAAVRIDPTAGLLGFAVVDVRGPLASREVRHALSMAVDREGLARRLDVPGLQTRATLAADGLSSLPAPAAPYWLTAPLATRQAEARRLIASQGSVPVRVRVAIPAGPGYRLLFAHLKRDWAAIGIDAVRVDMPRSADLRLVDAVAPSRGASWYLERFTCARSPACDEGADVALAGARAAGTPSERAAFFADADRRLTDAAVFVPIAAPMRWSLVAPRLTGFRTNALGVHSLTDLLGDGGN